MKKLLGVKTETVENDKVEIIGFANYKDEPDQVYVRYVGLRNSDGLPVKGWLFVGQIIWPDGLNNTEQ